MQFLAPLFLAGLLAIAIPIVVHLIGRQRAKVIWFSAMEFLLASQKRLATRLRLRQILLLLLRIAAVAAIPLVLAKPFVLGRSEVPLSAAHAQSAVIVLDDSASMQWRGGGASLFERAQARGKELVGMLGGDSDIALILGSEGAQTPIPDLTGDRGRVLRTLSAIGPSLRAADLPLAVRRASQILGSAGHAERRIFVLTDGAAHAWDAAGMPGPGGSPEVVVVDVSDEKAPPNLGLTGLEVAPAPQLGPKGVKLTAVVGNFSEEAVKSLPITLHIAGKPVARGLIDLPPHTQARKTFFHAFTEGGYYDAAAELPSDGLLADNLRYARVEVRKETRVLLIDGDPRTVRRDDELFYLETALHPAEESDAQLKLQSVTPDAVPKRLGDYDVVFLCNVKAPAAPLAAAMRTFVEGGGGLFISVGDNVDPDAYQQAFGDLLPQPLKGARVAAPDKRSEGESGLENEGPAERLGQLDRRHPMLSVFPQEAGGLRSARFYRLMLLAPIPDTAKRRSLLRFESGAPALVEAEIGAGRVLLYTSTLDRDWTDLPIRPGFLPLMQQAARYLARAPMREPEPPGLVGRPHLLPVAADEGRVEVTMPSGTHHLFDRTGNDAKKELVFGETTEAGIYRVSTAAVGGALSPRPALAFAVNVDGKESIFAKAKVGGTADKDGLRKEASSNPAPTRRIELWHLVAAALLGFLLIEGLLARPA